MTEGLRKCWILLKPQHKTISDLSSHILRVFDLHNACPHGLLLSMEGFALPPFEFTCILKDKDIIRVKKKGSTSTEIIKIGDGLNDSLNMVELIDKPPVTTGMNLLANEEFEKESSGYESEPEEDVENSPEVKTVSKKRKALMDLRFPKRKKTKSASAGKCLEVPENVGTNACAEQNGTLSIVNADKKSNKSRKSTPETKKRNKNKSASTEKCLEVSANVGTSVCTGQNGTLTIVKADERSSKSTEATCNTKKSCPPEQNGNGSVDAPHTLSGSKKFPSRSARRKKAKRQWLKEQLKAEKKEQNQMQLFSKINQQSSKRDNHNVSEKSPELGSHKLPEEKLREDNQLGEQGSDIEGDVVPIVIRPGHIRFEPLKKGGDDQAVLQNYIPTETFHWNGITSKKMGQKWGKEKAGSCKRTDYNNFRKESSCSLSIEEQTPVYDCTNFEDFPLYASLPKEGDVIAYRVVELSSSWTPELSSYRVGKISKYDRESNIVILFQVPGYPVVPEKIDDEASAALPETTPYGEDGSLEIKFSTLHEVRLVRHGNLESAKSVASGSNEVQVRDHNDHEANTSAQENEKRNPWEEINQALTAKKELLSQEDGWKKTVSSRRSPWSYKASRGSSLGPTIALLRAQNGI
ncbi:coilin [Salix suchowensis]|nr:coilin [Salix suchowensis]